MATTSASSGFAESCVAKSPTGPVFGVAPNFFSTNSCQEIYNPSVGNDFLIDVIDQEVKPALATTFALIKQKAPNAKVFVVRLPSHHSRRGPVLRRCPTRTPSTPNTPVPPFPPPFPQNAVPFAAGDEAYLHHVEEQLDLAIQQAAAAQSFTHVPTFAQTADHSLCTAQPYISGFSLTPTTTPDPVPGSLRGLHRAARCTPTRSVRGSSPQGGAGGDRRGVPTGRLPTAGASLGWWVLAPALLLAGCSLAVRLARRRTGSRPGPA